MMPEPRSNLLIGYFRRPISATSAFGALKNVLTSLSVDLRVKGRIYNALVLSILLYGSEAWCLREDLFNRLHSYKWRELFDGLT